VPLGARHSSTNSDRGPAEHCATNVLPRTAASTLGREENRPLLIEQSPRRSLPGWRATAPAPPDVVAAALADLLESAAPPLAGQSGADSERFVAAAMREPSRNSELHALLAHFAGSSAPESSSRKKAVRAAR
jgi:hypothetical protein